MPSSSSNAKFSSEGFDLDAASTQQDSEVVLELGGGVSRVQLEEQPSNNESRTTATSTTDTSVLAAAEDYKQQGNEQFRQHHFLEAYDYYTMAMEATPGMQGDEILKLEAAWMEERRKEARKQLDEDDRRRRTSSKTQSGDESNEGDATTKPNNEQQQQSKQPPPEFQLDPPHPHGPALAVYYANRAACLLALDRLDEAQSDCTVAIHLHPTYTKAWMRRSKAHEKLTHTDRALEDAQKALQLQPHDAALAANVRRLQKLEDARLEQLKAETMDKLKELGNSLLGNFGLSLDNFQAVQDPQTGSYSISFNQ